MALVEEMPVKPIGELVGEHDTKSGGSCTTTSTRRSRRRTFRTERLGIDDTSFRRRQDYVSVFCDLERGERRAVFVTEGAISKRSSNSRVFSKVPAAIRRTSRRSARTCRSLPGRGARPPSQEQVTFDRYHVKQKLGEAIDTVRRTEAKQHKELLKNTRYLWLKRPDNLTERQLDWLDELLLQPLDTVRAYEQALKFDDFYELRDPAGAEEYLRRWVTEAKASELEPLVQFAEMLEAHWSGVIRWHQTRVSNGLLEGLNSLIQAAKREPAGTAQRATTRR